MQQEITQKDRDRFRKIILVMKSTSMEGERVAAEQAAKRLAAQWGMELQEAIELTHPEVYGERHSEEERTQRRKSAYEAWETGTMRMMKGKEAREKYEFEMARQRARDRGLDEKHQDPAQKKKPQPRSFHQGGKIKPADTFRLISVLLKDGLPLGRVAELAGVSTNEVARVYLLNR